MFRRFLMVLIFLSIYTSAGFWPFVLADTRKSPAVTFEIAFEAGEKAFSVGDFSKAVTAFQSALIAQPNHARTRLRLGQSMAACNRHPEAISQFQYLLNGQPKSAPIRFELAKSLLKTGNTAEARKQLDWITRVDPANESAKVLLASIQDVPNIQIEAPPPGARQSPTPLRGASPNGWTPAGFVKFESPATKPSIMIETGKTEPKKPIMPAADPSIKGWKVSDFLGRAGNSAGITIEYAKFCIEKGDLDKASQNLDQAEELISSGYQFNRMLEIKILKSMIALYKADVRLFGQILMEIKPQLTKNTAMMFLDVYNKAQAADNPVNVARIIGGIAMGATHYLIASRIFSDVVANAPNDTFALRLLGQAQLESRDYQGAEKTFYRIVQFTPKDPEANFNLSRFYITGKFDPAKAKYYGQIAAQLNPSDDRIQVLRGVTDYFNGKTQETSTYLRKLQPKLKDQNLINIVQRTIQCCETPAKGAEQARLELMLELALPGSDRSSPEGISRLGEELLRCGSYFGALKCFVESRDLSEMGRVYLALASNLAVAGDEAGAAVAAGFGMNAINDDLKRNPSNAKAHLYLALYHLERNDPLLSRQHVDAGLEAKGPASTRRQLLALRSQGS